MPFGDRTGPQGSGPGTGRGAGYCSGFSGPGYMNPVPGRGRGFSRGVGSGWIGRGRGWRCQYWMTGMPGWARAAYPEYPYIQDFTAREEVDVLRNQADFLKKQLEDIQDRINTLEKARKHENE
jgi:hypothetical protein